MSIMEMLNKVYSKDDMDGILIPVKVAVKSTKTVRGEIKIIASAALLTSSALKIVVVTLNVRPAILSALRTEALAFTRSSRLRSRWKTAWCREKLGSALLTVSNLLRNNKMALLSKFHPRARK